MATMLHTVFETELVSDRSYKNPFWDVDVQVKFAGPAGQVYVRDAFWDGGFERPRWGVRFSPDAVGIWEWETGCSDTDNAALHGQRGTFTCVPYEGENPLYRYGPVRLSPDHRSFVWADGSPCFWLADTAWNGVLRATDENWARYLSVRADQGFTAVQFVSTQWRGAMASLGAERAFEGTEHITVLPEFFRNREGRVAAINAAGLLAAPVILWALWESDPGQILAEPDAIRLARYIVARWGAYQVVWFLGGDGNYLDERAARWCRIGRAVFGEDSSQRDRLATMHPCGQTWVGELFRDEPWYDFIGYQSGHGSSGEHLRWLVEGPPATHWDTAPVLPVINLEPNYEGHPSYHIDRQFNDYEVRRAAYWSMLVSPPAGVTYGTNPIWVWSDSPQVPDGHERIGVVAPWEAGLLLPGITSMTVMRALFETLPWWTLRPAPEVLISQPGLEDPTAFIAAAKTEDGQRVVVYIPRGGPAQLNLDALPSSPVVCWFNPRSGDWTDICALSGAPGMSAVGQVCAPDGQDWVLVVAGAETSTS